MTLTSILELASGQHGLVARHQVLGVELTNAAWRHLKGHCDWEPMSHSVLRHRSAPRSQTQLVLAAVLDAGSGAVLTGRSAAAHWGLPGFALRPAEVAVARRRARGETHLGLVRHNRRWPLHALTVLEGVPTVRPEALMVELASVIHPKRLERALDNAWSRRLLSGPAVTRYLDSVGSRGRSGVADLRALLRARGDKYVPPASNLEARFVDVLERAGLPAMRRQVDLGDDQTWCGRVDFRDEVLPIVIEVDSERYHSALSDREADVARQRELERIGFVVGRVTDLQVWHRPAEVAAEVQRCRRVALEGLAA